LPGIINMGEYFFFHACCLCEEAILYIEKHFAFQS
jgi:hypothetical protein